MATIHRVEAVTRAPYPLDWPDGWDRTPGWKRSAPKHDTRLAPARDGLLREIRLMGGRNTVITSNLPTRRDGLPYADGRVTNGDPGVAVYWNQVVGNRSTERVMACDRWNSVGGNLRALAMSIGALRGLDRWGSSSMVDRAFSGFAALPPAPSDWRSMLGSPRDLETARAAFRRLALAAHPDRGGSQEEMARLNEAWDAAQRELP
jgi:hypothetical protein